MKNLGKAPISWKWAGMLCCFLLGLFGAGAAQGSPPNSCDDGNTCTTDFLDSYTKHCGHTPISGCLQVPKIETFENLVDCNDRDPCTEDRWAPDLKVCEHLPIANCDPNALQNPTIQNLTTFDRDNLPHIDKVPLPKFQGVVARVTYLLTSACTPPVPAPPGDLTSYKACLASAEVQTKLNTLLENFSSRFRCQKGELPEASQSYEEVISVGEPYVAFAKFAAFSCMGNPAQELPRLIAIEDTTVLPIIVDKFVGWNSWQAGVATCHANQCNILIGGTPSYVGILPAVDLKAIEPVQMLPQPTKVENISVD